jgi:hypothetical protein
MRELRVRCPGCGDLDVSAGDVVVTQRSPGLMAYSFRCPQCAEVAHKACDPRVGRLLLLGGAQADDATVDGLAAFGPQHVTELRTLLDRPDWINHLRRAS